MYFPNIALNERPAMDEVKDKRYYERNYYSSANVEEIIQHLDSPLHRYRIRKVLELYTPRANETVLDLGCAWGTFSFALQRFAGTVIGADFSEKAAQICNQRKLKADVSNLCFLCADAQMTALKSASVDVVVSADLFEHLYPDQFEKVMDECQRILKPGGKLVIWTPHRGHILEILKNHDIILKHDPSHVDYKSMDVLLRALGRRHFRIVKRYYAESHVPVLRYIEKIGLGLIPFLRRRIAILAQKEA
jgi:cyclopropane fatty-acyl-phospholipid synthase-like methyltransferase